MKFINAFSKIKDYLSNYTFDANNENYAIQVTLTNKDCGGTFYIEVKDNVLVVEPYDYRDNNLCIDATVGDFTKMLEKRLDIAKALESGRISVFGDIAFLDKFTSSLKKNEVKKEEPKKATKTITKTKKSTK